MKRHLLTWILSGFVASLLLVGNAEACHKRTCACAPVTCAVYVPAPCPPPAPVCVPVCQPVCAPRKCGGLFSFFRGFRFGCHRICAPPPCPVPCGDVVVYNAPVTYSSPQTSAQH
jgi:hypothetical protein